MAVRPLMIMDKGEKVLCNSCRRHSGQTDEILGSEAVPPAGGQAAADAYHRAFLHSLTNTIDTDCRSAGRTSFHSGNNLVTEHSFGISHRVAAGRGGAIPLGKSRPRCCGQRVSGGHS
ncbi:MAG: hypothetical protein MZV63_12680 [Marinilabiliales bacterium]|nr:hypothetical protein [Marinilabiliales bacterium]